MNKEREKKKNVKEKKTIYRRGLNISHVRERKEGRRKERKKKKTNKQKKKRHKEGINE